jgi:hypothetical protein
MGESALYPLIRERATKLGHRLWRMNTGMAWVGSAMIKATARQTVTLEPGDVVLRQARPFHGGSKGMLDLFGFTVRDGVPVYTEGDAKAPGGRVRPEQAQRIEMLLSHGAIAGIWHDADQYQDMLTSSRP